MKFKISGQGFYLRTDQDPITFVTFEKNFIHGLNQKTLIFPNMVKKNKNKEHFYKKSVKDIYIKKATHFLLQVMNSLFRIAF